MLDYLDIEKVIICLQEKRRKNGVEKYIEIMNLLHNCDVSNNNEFQKMYNGFYRMRQRKKEFYQTYFYFLENNKSSHSLKFEDVLSFLYASFSRIEASFSSKLLATINPSMPIWDKNVMSNLSIKTPTYGCKNRFNKTIETYYTLNNWYKNYLDTDNAKRTIWVFDEIFPNNQISDTKKIDFALWSLGQKNTGNFKHL